MAFRWRSAKCGASNQKRDQQKLSPILRPIALLILKECMIFSPSRSYFGGSCGVRKQSRMWRDRLLKACLVTSAFLAAILAARPALAQTNFDRPGSDYQSGMVPSGDPADCALVCERDRRCRAWSFNYPTDLAGGAVCWLKSNVPSRSENNCCV